jgi:hypothetical protein
MGVKAILQQARDLGITLRLAGDRLQYAPKSLATEDFVEALRQHKAEVMACLEAEGRETSLFDLPFPMGYGGLPKAQVELAELVNDKFGINDPVHRTYNVLSWVRGHYVDLGQNRGPHYQAIKREQQRLGQLLNDQVDNS